MTKIPRGWSTSALGDVCRIVSGATPKTAVANYWGGDIAWITPNDLSKDRSQVIHSGERSLSRTGYDSCSARTFPAGSVIISSRAPVGYVAIAGREMCTNQGCKTAVPPAELDSKYLYWFLLHSKPDLERRASGTTFKEISGKRFAETVLWWPPVEEQRRIVEILEDHLSRLDAADDGLSRARRRTAALREWLALQAVTGGAPTAEPGDDATLGIGFRWSRVDEVAGGMRSNVIIGPFGSSLKTSDYTNDGVPLVFVRNVRSSEFSGAGRPRVSPAKAMELRAHQVMRGDILITKMGDPPGDAAVYRGEEPAIVTADVIRLRPGRDFSADYVSLAINTALIRRQIERITRGVAQRKVSLARFRSEILIPAPSIQEQLQLAEAVAGHRSVLDSLSEAAGNAELRSKALQQALLQAAFSGRLTGSTADDEIIEEFAGV